MRKAVMMPVAATIDHRDQSSIGRMGPVVVDQTLDGKVTSRRKIEGMFMQQRCGSELAVRQMTCTQDQHG
jgi:hypothetical protein